MSYGMVHWVELKAEATKPLNAMPVFYIHPSAPSVTLIPNPTNQVRIPTVTTKIEPPARGKQGVNQSDGQPPKTKQNRSTADYPIVEVTTAQATYTSDSKKLAVILTIANSTSTNTNAHIVLQPVWVEHGQENQNQPIAPAIRDIGLGPPPYTFEFKQEIGLSETGAANWDAETLAVMFYVTITYPDRGKNTTYHYKGEARKGLEQLDFLESDWQEAKP